MRTLRTPQVQQVIIEYLNEIETSQTYSRIDRHLEEKLTEIKQLGL